MVNHQEVALGQKIVAMGLITQKQIFVPQIAGHISCFNNLGKLLWHQHLQGATLFEKPIIKRASRVDKYKVIFATTNEDIYSLDADNGYVNWCYKMYPEAKTALTTNLSRFATFVSDLKADVDGDNMDDLVSFNFNSSLCVISGRTGEWLSSNQLFGHLNSSFFITNINKDAKEDLIFVDNQGRLFVIDDIVSYVKGNMLPPAKFVNYGQKYSNLLVAYYNKLLKKRSYRRLEREIANDKSFWSSFYKAICALAQKNNKKAIQLLLRYKSNKISKIDLVKAIAYFNDKLSFIILLLKMRLNSLQ